MKMKNIFAALTVLAFSTTLFAAKINGPLEGASLEKLVSDPASVLGRMYFNTGGAVPKFFDGNWKTFAALEAPHFTANVGIGTTAPVFDLEVAKNGGNANLAVSSYGAGAASATSSFIGRRFDGTMASPTAVLAGDRLVALIGSGYDGVATNNSVAIEGFASENFGSVTPNHGGFLRFDTTANATAGGRQERMRINASGNVSINNANDTYNLDVTGASRFTGNLQIQDTAKIATATPFILSSSDLVAPMELVFTRNTGTNYSIQPVESTVAYRDLVLNPSGGNVGVGVSPNVSYKLDVAGAAHVSTDAIIGGAANVAGLATLSSGMQLSGGTFATGRFYKDSSYGTVVTAQAGATPLYDLTLMQASGASFALGMPTGTNNLIMPGDVAINRTLGVTGAATFAGGVVSTAPYSVHTTDFNSGANTGTQLAMGTIAATGNTTGYVDVLDHGVSAGGTLALNPNNGPTTVGGTLEVAGKTTVGGVFESYGRGSIGESGLTTTHQNVVLTVGGTLTNIIGNATYGQVTLPVLNGYAGSSIFGEMIRPFFGRGSSPFPIMANLFLAKPLVPSTGAGAVQDTAMLYIDAPMAETVVGTNYAIKVDAGLSSFGGGILSTGTSTLNGSAIVGGNLTVGGGGPHTFAGEIDVKNAGAIKLDLANTDYVASSAGSKAQLYTGATSGNTSFNIQALTTGGNVAGTLNLNPNGGTVATGAGLSVTGNATMGGTLAVTGTASTGPLTSPSETITTPTSTVPLTGTVTATSTAALVGVGTLFTTELREGDRIALSSNPTGFGTVLNITDNTHIIVSGKLGNGTANATLIAQRHPFRVTDFTSAVTALIGPTGGVYSGIYGSNLGNPTGSGVATIGGTTLNAAGTGATQIAATGLNNPGAIILRRINGTVTTNKLTAATKILSGNTVGSIIFHGWEDDTVGGGANSGAPTNSTTATISAIATEDFTSPALTHGYLSFQTSNGGSGTTERMAVKDTYVDTTTIGKRVHVNSQAGNYTLLTGDDHVRYTGAGGDTFTLPAATGTGQSFTIKHRGTGILTLAAAGGENLDGVASFTMNTGDAIQVIDAAAGTWDRL